MPAVAVIGDYIRDIDVEHAIVGPSREQYRVDIVKELRTTERPGGAGAVTEMIRALGCTVLSYGQTAKLQSIKRRIFVDGTHTLRIDDDYVRPISDDLADRLNNHISRKVEYLVVSDYGKGMITDYLWNRLKQGPWKILVDPARQRELSWYQGAYAIFPNRQECRVESADFITTLVKLRSMFPCVCIKLDSEGMCVSEGTEHCHYGPACAPSDVVDVTGCGDAVIAAAAVALSNGISWMKSCEFANQVAGRKAMQRGASPVFIGDIQPIW